MQTNSTKYSNDLTFTCGLEMERAYFSFGASYICHLQYLLT